MIDIGYAVHFNFLIKQEQLKEVGNKNRCFIA
jgi:hypothetical protein